MSSRTLIKSSHGKGHLSAMVSDRGAMLGAFMRWLDIQITNSSLNDIAGALGCSLDEGS